MSDLISRQALMELARSHKNGMIDCNDIARVPTAYDVDKVVEQLEEETISLEDNYENEVLCIQKNVAIEIVQKGGAE